MSKKKEKVEFKMERNDEIEVLIKECVREEGIDTGGAKIAGLMVYPLISKNVAGRCIRTSKELKFFSDFDYLIEISNEYWEDLTPATRKILVLHECMHIGVRYDKEGEPRYGLVQHDVEDFSELIEKYGVHWIREINLVKEHLEDKGGEEE